MAQLARAESGFRAPTGSNNKASSGYGTSNQRIVGAPVAAPDDTDTPWLDASMRVFSLDGICLINEMKTMTEVEHVEFQDRAAFPNTEWSLVPSSVGTEKLLKETVILSTNIALKAIEETLYQVNGKWYFTSILAKTQ